MIAKDIQLSELIDTAHRVGERAAQEAVTMEKIAVSPMS